MNSNSKKTHQESKGQGQLEFFLLYLGHLLTQLHFTITSLCDAYLKQIEIQFKKLTQ